MGRSSSPRARFRPRLESLEGRLTPSSLPSGFTEFTTGGLTAPTAMEIAPDGRIFVAEQGGTLRVIKDGALLPTPFVSLGVNSAGERGLLGVALDPNFASNAFVYLYYTTATSPIHNRVSRFTASGDTAVPGSEVVLLDLENLSSATNHNGGAIHFGPDGRLYVAVGENANPGNSQDLTNRLGKILRINADGSVPGDNPFVGVPGAQPSIWSLGLRNPFSFAFQPGSGRMFINDVGAQTWEEINDGLRGANYGWPLTEGPTGDPRFVSPLFAYTHGAGDTQGCAIAGGAFYNPASVLFPFEYVGDYFFADFCNGWIRRFDTGSGQAQPFATSLPSFPVDLKVDADGTLLYLARGSGAGAGVVGRIGFQVNDAPGTFRLSASEYHAGEDGGLATVTVLRSGGSTGAVSVSFSAESGTATPGGDYTAVSGTLQFADRETRKTFTIPILQDADPDDGETVNVVLSSPAGTTLSGPSSAVLRIQDDDGFATANERFVSQAYLDLLLRPAESGGLAYWTGLLAQGRSRAEVAQGLIGSPEYGTVVVRQLYLTLLGREADNSGLNGFVQFLQGGGTVDQVRQVILGSPEYFLNRGGAREGGFLQALYFDTLDRPIDPTGQSYFTQRLVAGASRAAVAGEILASSEKRHVLVQETYLRLLRRPAEEGGEGYWVNALRQGLREEQMIAAFVASDEYFQRVQSAS